MASPLAACFPLSPNSFPRGNLDLNLLVLSSIAAANAFLDYIKPQTPEQAIHTAETGCRTSPQGVAEDRPIEGEDGGNTGPRPARLMHASSSTSTTPNTPTPTCIQGHSPRRPTRTGSTGTDVGQHQPSSTMPIQIYLIFNFWCMLHARRRRQR
ncbi:hypothetical protein C8F04DRAFT_1080199 [Mycena alexandri]|uniref:Uncharacterized protein n=1 Tax=Mycena alexandri TaxID=1745969 RepID=A0AAD6XAA2_9AGAR|nr:hypothetical protein C8F04DRAFT_1080199 [Mycena alexandri]